MWDTGKGEIAQRDARIGELNLALGNALAEVERLRHICKTISTGLRGPYATREDMWKLADSAIEQQAPIAPDKP